MSNCSKCGQVTYNWGICNTCEDRATLVTEARKQTELVKQAEYQLRLQTEQGERAEYQLREQNKLIELQGESTLYYLRRQTTLIEEQAISVDQAYDEGYSLNDFTSYYLTCDEKFYFIQPYLTPKLSKAYEAGAEKKISELFYDDSWKNKVFSIIKKIASERNSTFLAEEERFNDAIKELALSFEVTPLSNLAANYRWLSSSGESLSIINPKSRTRWTVAELINQVVSTSLLFPIAFEYKGATVSCGSFLVDLRIKIDETTGLISFLNHKKVSDNFNVNDCFNEVFDFDRMVKELNENGKKLRRLQYVLESTIIQAEESIQQVDYSNTSIIRRNYWRALTYFSLVFCFYFLFSKWFLVVLLPAFAIILVAIIFLGSVGAKFESKESAAQHDKNLSYLKKILKNVRAEMDKLASNENVEANKSTPQNLDESVNENSNDLNQFIPISESQTIQVEKPQKIVDAGEGKNSRNNVIFVFAAVAFFCFYAGYTFFPKISNVFQDKIIKTNSSKRSSSIESDLPELLSSNEFSIPSRSLGDAVKAIEAEINYSHNQHLLKLIFGFEDRYSAFNTPEGRVESQRLNNLVKEKILGLDAPAPKTEASSVPPQAAATCSTLRDCADLMVLSARTENLSQALSVAMQIDDMPKPQRGDRKAARKLNGEGLDALKQKKYEEATDIFLKAKDADALDEEIVANLVFTYSEAREYAKSEKTAYDSLLLNPRRANLWLPIAIAKQKQGKPKEALQAMWLAWQFTENKQRFLELIEKRSNEDTDESLKTMFLSAKAWFAENKRPAL